MTERFARRDMADHLHDEADMARYLEACVAEAPHGPDFIARVQENVAGARLRMQTRWIAVARSLCDDLQVDSL